MRALNSLPFLSFLTATTALFATGCSAGKDAPNGDDTSIGHDDDTSSPDTDDTSSPDDTDDTSDETPGVYGNVTGTVYLQLYTTDANGDMELLEWDTMYPDGYPFGSVFIAAYNENDEGHENYYDQNVISNPTVSPAPGGNPYGLTIDADDIDHINIYATVDQYADGIIATTEPTGAYASDITIDETGTVTDIDVTVLVPYWDMTWSGETGEGGFGYGGGGGGGGGGCSDPIHITGTATVESAYADGNIAVMLYDQDGLGPYYATSFTPTATSTGAEGTYDLMSCPDGGDMDVLGVWDSNLNGLFDPSDTWGAYAQDAETTLNPVNIGSEDLADKNVLIPFGDDHPSVVPFVSLSGTLTSTEDWSEFAMVYVSALKYRPEADFSVVDLDAGYDTESWEMIELAAATSLDFHVEVPANTIVYLWAYADTDGDGILNEVGDPVASLNDSTGRTVTGTSNQSGQDLVLTLIE